MASGSNRKDNPGQTATEIGLPEYSIAFFMRLFGVVVLAFLPFFLYGLLCLFLIFHTLAFAITSFPQGSESPLLSIVYGPVLIALILVLVGLIRPFFITRPNELTHELSPEEYKNFYTFCNSLGKRLNVDPVKRVLVTTDVIVDVYYETPQDFFKRRLSMKIGLPLIPILSLKEFASLYFHEISRYHNDKIRWGYLAIRFLNSWCRIVIHNEDYLASKVEVAVERFNWLRIPLLPLIFSFELVNGLFGVLLNLLEGVTRSTTDEIEFLADQVQANVGGVALFDHLLKHLVHIDQASQRALEQVLAGENVPRNMAELIDMHFKKNTVKTDQFIELALAERFNSWYFLPLPNTRTRRLRQLSTEDNLTFDGDLKFLLKNTQAIGEGLSNAYYQLHDIHASNSVNDSEGVDERTVPMSFPKEEQVLKRFTSGLYRRDLVWEFPQADKFSVLPQDKVIPFLNKLVVTIRQSLPDLTKYMQFADEYNKQCAKFHYAQWLIKDGGQHRVAPEEVEKIKLYKQDFEKQFEGKKEAYRKSYGVRVAAATALGKENKAYPSALKLIKMLSLMGQVQDNVNDTAIKVSTLEKLIERRNEGDNAHQNTIARLTKMVLKVIEGMERVMGQLPKNLLGKDVDIMEYALDLGLLNGVDYEKRVIDRFYEMLKYYGGFNTAISARLAQFVEMVEKTKDIESVVTTSINKN
ncbi:MAG: hypothetical protein K6L76_14565 [Agarilytica sp.]